MASLNGKTALVTGASHGNGHAIAKRSGRNSVSVVVNYAGSAEKVQEVVQAFEVARFKIARGASGVSKSAGWSTGKIIGVNRRLN